MSSMTNVENSENDEKSDIIESWDQINDIKESLLRGIYSYGFENPSPIQKKSNFTNAE